MPNILKKFTKDGVITIGDDDYQLDTPTFEIIDVKVDTVNSQLIVQILHTVMQGTIERKHSRNFALDFNALPASVKVTGKAFLDAIELEILNLPIYAGSVEQ